MFNYLYHYRVGTHKMNVRDRIIQKMTEKGVKQSDIVRYTGASKGTVNQWVAGKIEPSKKYDKKLAKFLNTTVDFINLGVVDVPVNYDPPSEYLGHIDSWDSSTPLDDDEAELPFFIEVELAAGIGSELTQENKGAKLRFSKSTLKKCNVEPGSAACVKVSGDSMEPRLYDGDVVGVNFADKRIVDGKTYAINHDGLLRIKRLYLMPGGALRINSFNVENHQDEILKSEDRGLVSVVGRVFWSSAIWK
jgi:phage repressor protein C with HTH and peptisase S24 domain